MIRLALVLLEDRLAVARLEPDASVPAWVAGRFTSITRTAQELSIVCDESSVPDDIRAERGWRVLAVRGPIPFETTGVAAALVAPLASAKISVFLISTFDTDYLLVKEEIFEEALAVLRSAGHEAA
jgi:uncharacterized protein